MHTVGIKKKRTQRDFASIVSEPQIRVCKCYVTPQQPGKLVLNKDRVPYKSVLGNRRSIPTIFWNGLWDALSCEGVVKTAQTSPRRIKELRPVRDFSPSMLLYGALSLFGTKFPRCHALLCFVTSSLASPSAVRRKKRLWLRGYVSARQPLSGADIHVPETEPTMQQSRPKTVWL